MARIFRALRRSSAPEAVEGDMAPPGGPRRYSVPRDLSPSFSRMERQKPPKDPVLVILQKLLEDLDDEIENEAENDSDSADADSDADDTTPRSVVDAIVDEAPRSLSSYDLVRTIWGGESNYLWQVCARTRSRMARDHTFSAELKNDVAHSKSMTTMVDRLRNITMADLVLPERSGWLFDLSENRNVWCVVADMLFCLFEGQDSETPKEVIILPGCAIRSLVYQTAIPQPSSSKTISGIDKYQIILDDCSSRRKHLFSVDCPTELDLWMAVLKSASTLDQDSDAADDDKTEAESRRHSLYSAVVTSGHGDFVSPRYIPSPPTSNRIQKVDKESQEKYSTSKSVDFTKNQAQRNSIGDIRRKLRRDTEVETPKPTPLKATHFESSPSASKKPGPFKKLRSFGSLESLFKPKKKDDTSESQYLEGRRYSKGSIASKNSSSSSSLDFSTDSPLLRNAGRRSLSAIDFAKSETDYGIKFGKTDDNDIKGQPSVQLKDLHDASICGFLQQKVLIRWQRVWCMVCRGKLYGFKSQSPEEYAYLNVVLSNSNITYLSDQDKRYKKPYVFKISRHRRKSLYFNASDKNELSRWLQVLQMEANKVQGDADSVDSGQGQPDGNVTFSIRPNDGADSSPSTPTYEHVRGGSDSPIDLTSAKAHRFSLPNVFDGGNDSGYVPSADESDAREYSASPGNLAFLQNDLPEHDPALKHVWQQDKNYLINMVRAKLRRSKKRNNSEQFSNLPLPGPNNEGLMVVTDAPEVRMPARKSKGSGPRDVRRTMSFHGANSARASASAAVKACATPPVIDSPTSSPSCRKRHKPLAVKKLAARDIENCAISGYMERRSFSGQWIKYWYVLKDGTIFCYLTPDDNVTVDILNLQGYKIAYLIDKFRGKRFVLQLSHEEYSSIYMSLESRETMTEWLECLQLATGVPPSPHGVLDDQDAPEQLSDKSRDRDYLDKCQSVKQKLLAEMLRQKHELERKQATRQKRQSGDGSNTPDVMSEEDQIRDVTRLRQRRMSAQIKMDTIQKQLQTVTTSGKKFPFKFGSKKKVPENNNEQLQEQLRELSSKLEEIDKDLSSHSKSSELLDMNQNKRHVHNEELRTSQEFLVDNSNGDVSKSGAINIKASVQKLKTKTFAKSAKSKSKKLNGGDLSNGNLNHSDTSALHSCAHELRLDLEACRLQDDGQEYDSENGSESLRSDSFTDLTKAKGSTSSADDSVFTELDQSGLKRTPKRKAVSNPVTPRKEIDPDVMAEIDAFEDFTRQVLSARNVKTTS